MREFIADFFATDVHGYLEELASLHDEIAPDAPPVDEELFSRLVHANRASLEACRELEQRIDADEELLLRTRARFRDAIQDWFDQSWFMYRAKSKPRGYPGDFELLSGLYEGVEKSTGLGGYLDRYFLNTPLAVAVRDRLRSTREFLLSEVRRNSRPLRFLNVACGPCWEYTHDWRACGPVSVTCVDIDREAVAFVNSQADTLAAVGVRLEVRAYNALRMSSLANNLKHFGRPDVIYSVGLCDYVPDNALIRMLRGWRETIAPGGIVYVAFKDCLKYDKTGYAWHVDWHFIPRTDEDCRRLLDEAGFDSHGIQMNRGESQVIMSYACRDRDHAPQCAESESRIVAVGAH